MVFFIPLVFVLIFFFNISLFYSSNLSFYPPHQQFFFYFSLTNSQQQTVNIDMRITCEWKLSQEKYDGTSTRQKELTNQLQNIVKFLYETTLLFIIFENSKKEVHILEQNIYKLFLFY